MLVNGFGFFGSSSGSRKSLCGRSKTKRKSAKGMNVCVGARGATVAKRRPSGLDYNLCRKILQDGDPSALRKWMSRPTFCAHRSDGSDDGYSPWTMAMLYGSAHAVSMFLKHPTFHCKCCDAKCTERHYNHLMYAVEFRDASIVRAILQDPNADIFAKDASGNTVFDYLCHVSDHAGSFADMSELLFARLEADLKKREDATRSALPCLPVEITDIISAQARTVPSLQHAPAPHGGGLGPQFSIVRLKLDELKTKPLDGKACAVVKASAPQRRAATTSKRRRNRNMSRRLMAL